jgi:predicted O-methyltransferase YrrM
MAQRFQHPLGYRIKREADGMLRPYVYEAIYNAVKAAPHGDWLEIGGARGGSTVAIAMAIRDSGSDGMLVTAEKFEGGSWEKTYKSAAYGDNFSWWTRNVRKFHVQDHVVLYPHGVTDETADEVKSLLGTLPLAGMMLDADGWVGRDFKHFWPLIRDGGIIIVDDYPTSGGNPHEKKARTYHLLNAIIRWGLYEITSRHADTVIGVKPAGADFSRFDMGELEYIAARHQAAGEKVEW